LTPGRDLLVFPRHGALDTAPIPLREAWLTALHKQGLVSGQEEN
jgi:hypothetical protein